MRRHPVHIQGLSLMHNRRTMNIWPSRRLQKNLHKRKRPKRVRRGVPPSLMLVDKVSMYS